MGLWAVYTGAWSPGTGELCPRQKKKKEKPKDKGFCAEAALVKPQRERSWQPRGPAGGDAGMLPQVTNCTTRLGHEPPPSPSARVYPCGMQPADPGRVTWCLPA